jgi:hypothetical protein
MEGMMQITKLSEKAMLVKLTMRRANLTKRDSIAESIIQSQLDDSSLIVNSKLFRDKNNPINQILSKASEVYTEHKRRTLAWADKGPRVLPNTQYMEYTQIMRAKISEVDSMMQKYMPNYDTYVQLDISYRSKNQTNSRAKSEDYPTVNEFQQKMGFDLKFMPMPDKKHFLFDLSEDDEKAFDQLMGDVEVATRNETIQKMLDPLAKLVEKLNTPIGADGAIFRDSAVENIVEGIEMARKLTLDESPEVKQLTDELNKEISRYAEHMNWLRESPIVREQAAKKLSDIASQMGAFMGVPA